jgi:hypothetical protein
MQKFCTLGDALFVVGIAFEIAAIWRGVHSQVVGLGLASYGLSLWACGYLR